MNIPEVFRTRSFWIAILTVVIMGLNGLRIIDLPIEATVAIILPLIALIFGAAWVDGVSIGGQWGFRLAHGYVPEPKRDKSKAKLKEYENEIDALYTFLMHNSDFQSQDEPPVGFAIELLTEAKNEGNELYRLREHMAQMFSTKPTGNVKIVDWAIATMQDFQKAHPDMDRLRQYLFQQYPMGAVDDPSTGEFALKVIEQLRARAVKAELNQQ